VQLKHGGDNEGDTVPPRKQGAVGGGQKQVQAVVSSDPGSPTEPQRPLLCCGVEVCTPHFSVTGGTDGGSHRLGYRGAAGVGVAERENRA
jgi:hypothetical protein